MTAPAHWLPLVFVAGPLLFVAFLWAWDRHLAKHYRVFNTKLRCFTKAKLVQIGFARDAKTGEFLGVRSCTAFADPEHVTCDQHCLDVAKRTKSFASAATN